jgi:DNA (cytosine-5)-methyltransferase 1
MKKINVLDLFCGAGGLSCGFERAGFNIVLGRDNDKKALFKRKKSSGKKSIEYFVHTFPLSFVVEKIFALG